MRTSTTLRSQKEKRIFRADIGSSVSVRWEVQRAGEAGKQPHLLVELKKALASVEPAAAAGFLAVGLRAASRAVERGEALAALLCTEDVPRLLIQHFPVLCGLHAVPLAILGAKPQALAAVVGSNQGRRRRALAVVLRRQCSSEPVLADFCRRLALSSLELRLPFIIPPSGVTFLPRPMPLEQRAPTTAPAPSAASGNDASALAQATTATAPSWEPSAPFSAGTDAASAASAAASAEEEEEEELPKKRRKLRPVAAPKPVAPQRRPSSGLMGRMASLTEALAPTEASRPTTTLPKLQRAAKPPVLNRFASLTQVLAPERPQLASSRAMVSAPPAARTSAVQSAMTTATETVAAITSTATSIPISAPSQDGNASFGAGTTASPAAAADVAGWKRKRGAAKQARPQDDIEVCAAALSEALKPAEMKLTMALNKAGAATSGAAAASSERQQPESGDPSETISDFFDTFD